MEIEVLDVDGQWRSGPDEGTAPRRPRTPWTSRRVALVVVALLGAVLLVGAGVVAAVADDRLRADLDHELDDALQTALTDTAEGRSPGEGSDGRIVQVLQSAGAVVASSPGLDPTMISVNGPFDGSTTETELVEVDGRTAAYRVTWATVPSMPGLASTTVVVVGLPVAPTDDAVLRLRAALVVLAGTAAVAAGIAGWVLHSRRPLAPT